MKKFKTVIITTLIIAIIAGGVYLWHTNEINLLNQRLADEQARKDLMSERIIDIERKLASSETENDSLLAELDGLLTEEVTMFDSEAIMEEILEIGELATVEYRYTNVGTLDSSKKFSFMDVTIPFSDKTAVITMDGVIKAGVDMSNVEITTNESTKTISVIIPEAKTLSNELFEDSMAVYVEKDSIFSKINLDDSSSIRNDIKTKAQQNALDNGILDQAQKKAEEIITWLIEETPYVKDTYTISVKYK